MPDAVLSIMAPLFLMAIPLLSPFYKVGNQNTEFRMTNKESHFPLIFNVFKYLDIQCSGSATNIS